MPVSITAARRPSRPLLLVVAIVQGYPAVPILFVSASNDAAGGWAKENPKCEGELSEGRGVASCAVLIQFAVCAHNLVIFSCGRNYRQGFPARSCGSRRAQHS